MEKELAFPQFVPLHIGYWEHHADWNFDNINSPFFRIYLVVNGEARVIINHYEQALTSGHLYIIPPFTTHTDRCEGDFSLYYIHGKLGQRNRFCQWYQSRPILEDRSTTDSLFARLFPEKRY